MMTCSQCGFQNKDDSSFCEQCGRPLTTTQPQAVQPQAVQPQATQPQTVQPAYRPSTAPVYIPQPAYQPSSAMPPHPPMAQNPVVNAVKRIGGSPLCLGTAILMTASWLLSVGYSVLSSLTDYDLSGSLLSRFFSSFGADLNPSFPFSPLFSLGSIVTILLSGLVCLAIWLFYASCRKPQPSYPSTAGITMIRVVTIIRMVCTIVAFIAVLILAFFLCIGGSALTFSSADKTAAAVTVDNDEYGGDNQQWEEFWDQYGENYGNDYDYGNDYGYDYGYDYGSSISAVAIGMGIGLLLVVGGGLTLSLIYFIKLLKSLRAIKEAATGDPHRNISMFVVVAWFIAAFCSILGACNLLIPLFSGFINRSLFLVGISNVIGTLVGGVVWVLLGVLFIKLRAALKPFRPTFAAPFQPMVPPAYGAPYMPYGYPAPQQPPVAAPVATPVAAPVVAPVATPVAAPVVVPEPAPTVTPAPAPVAEEAVTAELTPDQAPHPPEQQS